MGRITSSVGLISGIPIAQTVDQLVKLQAEPRDRLVESVKKLGQQQTAVTDLTARLIAVQLVGNQLGNASLFEALSASSSHADLLAATTTASATAGTYQFTPLRRAQSQQLLSSGFASRTTAVGAGALSFRHGGAIDDDTPLELLNGGAGIQRGQIRISDRAGASADIDLRTARTVTEVLDAINAASIGVRASIDGDAIRLTDVTGATSANLRVQEVGIGGKTAESLGLAGINVGASAATGEDILRLGRALSIDRLNDGLGLRISKTLADLRVSLRDGSTLDIDLHRAAIEEDFARGITEPAAGIDARLQFSAMKKGADYDDYEIQVVNDPAITAGGERIDFDNSDPDNKTITLRIDAGATTAAHIVAAAAADADFKELFAVSLAGGDGSGLIDVADGATTSGGAAVPAAKELTLGQVIDAINAADPAKLRIEIAPDGDGLRLVDLTADAGHDFKIEGLFGSQLLADLGLDGEADGAAIEGERILAGPNTTLLKSLRGGAGLGTLGAISLTDRAGAAATVDLSTAETVADVVALLNEADVQIEVALNAARSGLVLTDTSGGAGNLIVADLDADQGATKLGIANSTAADAIESGHLKKRTVGEATPLSSLRGGAGIASGRIRIFDTAGLSNSLDLSSGSFETVGDVIDAINGLAVGVQARINDDGDGILIVDTAQGDSGPLQIVDLSGKAARDLGILGTGADVEIAPGETRSAINGSTTFRIEFDEDDTLDDVVAKVNATGAGVKASVLFDGVTHRLSLVSERSGEAGAFLFNTSEASFTLQETAKGQDALLLYGSAGNSASIIASSSTNTFSNLVAGLTLDIKSASTQTVSVTVAANNSAVTTRVKSFVDAYNGLAAKLAEYTSFDAATNKKGVLFGSGETLRVQADMHRLLSGRIGTGEANTLGTLGITFKDDGTLEYDETKLNDALAADRDAVTEFFIKDQAGLSDKLNALVESLAGRDRSLLISRAAALENKIRAGNERAEFLSQRLDRLREKLLRQFERMESAIARIQGSLSAVAAIQALPPLVATG